jgi:NTP pyrophosphatase (non-canonical NTP hydrolase)
MFDIEGYEEFVDSMWRGQSKDYTMIALAGEVGEACNWHKKGMRNPDHYEEWDPDWEAHLLKELGDIAYYLTRACHEHGVSLADVMQGNQRKLEARHGSTNLPQSS